MTKVFIGGSRRLGKLSQPVQARLANIVSRGHSVLIGDANGADKAVQAFFAEQDYQDLTIYCVNGRCRNNLGHWPSKSIDAAGEKRRFSDYAARDFAMVTDASCGFMIWDGKSKGTLNNIRNLLSQSKATLVYLAPSHEFTVVDSAEGFRRLLALCDPLEVERLTRLLEPFSLPSEIKSAGLFQ